MEAKPWRLSPVCPHSFTLIVPIQPTPHMNSNKRKIQDQFSSQTALAGETVKEAVEDQQKWQHMLLHQQCLQSGRGVYRSTFLRSDSFPGHAHKVKRCNTLNPAPSLNLSFNNKGS